MNNTKTTDLTIATEIVKQLGGSSRLSAMIGANNFVADNYSAMFRFKGSRLFNHIKIKLNGLDLYDLTFIKIVKYDIKNTKIINNIYFDQLKEIFQNETKLYLTL